MYSAGELHPQPAGDPGADAQEEEARAHGRVHHRPGQHRHHVLSLHPPHADRHQLRGKLLHNLHNHRSATRNRHWRLCYFIRSQIMSDKTEQSDGDLHCS